ncbi:redoxin domain-containing protein [Arthrobacter sp. TMN-37]
MTRLPVPGEPAPEARLVNQHGETVRVSSLRGSPAALVFFPSAFSSVCTQELADLQAGRDRFAAHGVRILGLSTDSKYTLRAYAEAEGLSFDLLSDFWPHGAAARAFGVFDERAGHARRSTFFLDARGVVSSVVSSGPGEPRSAGDYAAALAALAGAA